MYKNNSIVSAGLVNSIGVCVCVFCAVFPFASVRTKRCLVNGDVQNKPTTLVLHKLIRIWTDETCTTMIALWSLAHSWLASPNDDARERPYSKNVIKRFQVFKTNKSPPFA